ncbi:hypothetical protein PSKAS_26550 [Peribacillus sp. N1]
MIFVFSFIKNVSTFHLSVIAHAAGVGAIVITFVLEKVFGGNFEKNLQIVMITFYY